MSEDPPALDARISWSPRAVRGQAEPIRVDVSIRLPSEVGILFGASGAGKSSVLRLIAGLLRPDRGSIHLGRERLFDSDRRIDVPLRSRRIGMIFQDDLLFAHRDVAGNIGFGLKGWDPKEARERLIEIADLCGVSRLLDRHPSTLSGGERQRVGLARALAPRPRLLLCDEPISALDLDGRFALIERLREVRRAEAIPMLFVTHSPAEAIAIGSHLFLIENGRIVEESRSIDVLARSGPVSGLEDLQNIFAAQVEGHDAEGGETRLRLIGGPALIVPHQERPIGARVTVAVRADDILLAKGPLAELSARNRVVGTVDRVVYHRREAEVLVRTGSLTWIVSVVASAVQALELKPAVEVRMIIKARSCRILERPDVP